MGMTKKLKLSELADNIELTVEESSITYTVAELKREISKLGEPHHETSGWHTIKREVWKPCATTMIVRYIEDEGEDMYENWESRAMHCINEKVVADVQKLLDEAFQGNYATEYWTCIEPVEIDIYPLGKREL